MDEAAGVWESVQFSDVVERRTERNSVGNTRVLTISAAQGLVDQTSYFNRVVASKDLSPYYLLRNGDFAYNKSYSRGYPVGVIRRLDRYEAGVVSPLYICFRPKSGLVDSNFLDQLLRAGGLDDGISLIAKEGARNHGLLNVGTTDFFELEIDLPPIEEQRRIAETLDGIDETIRVTERVIAKLKVVGVGLLKDIKEQGVVSGQSVALGDAGSWLSGGTPSTNQPSYWDGAIPWITASSLTSKYLTESRRTLTEAGVAAGSRLVPKGTILCVVRGMSLKKEFRVGIAGTQVAFGQDCKALRPASSWSPEYLRLQLVAREAEILSLVDEASHGTGRLQMSLLSSVMIDQVSLTEQRRLVGIFDAHERHVAIEEDSLQKLRYSRLGVASDLLSGRVRTVAS